MLHCCRVARFSWLRISCARTCLHSCTTVAGQLGVACSRQSATLHLLCSGCLAAGLPRGRSAHAVPCTLVANVCALGHFCRSICVQCCITCRSNQLCLMWRSLAWSCHEQQWGRLGAAGVGAQPHMVCACRCDAHRVSSWRPCGPVSLPAPLHLAVGAQRLCCPPNSVAC